MPGRLKAPPVARVGRVPINPPPENLAPTAGREGQLLSLIDDLRTELKATKGDREAKDSLIDELRTELKASRKERGRGERKEKPSFFDSIRPKSRSGWAIGIATIVTALTAGVAAVVTSVGGGEGLAAVVHAPKLREQMEAILKEKKDLEERVEKLEKRAKSDERRDAERWRFVGAALCKGAMTTASGLDCNAVQWEARSLPTKKGEAPEPWRARDYVWPQ